MFQFLIFMIFHSNRLFEMKWSIASISYTKEGLFKTLSNIYRENFLQKQLTA